MQFLESSSIKLKIWISVNRNRETVSSPGGKAWESNGGDFKIWQSVKSAIFAKGRKAEEKIEQAAK